MTYSAYANKRDCSNILRRSVGIVSLKKEKRVEKQMQKVVIT